MKITLYAIVLLMIFCCCLFCPVFVHAQSKDAEKMAKQYPPDRYLVRPGGGSSPENAAEAARLEIAKYFESKISGESIVKEWAESRTEKGKTTQKHATELSNVISVKTAREIPGIEITGTEQDKKTGEYTTWAVLDKNSYVSVLKDRIAKRDGEIDQCLTSTGKNDMQKLGNLNKALQNLIEREKDCRDLSLLEPGSTVESRSSVMQDVLTNIDLLVSDSFDVGVVFLDDVDSRIQTGLTKGIVDAGIRLKQYPDISSACGAGTDLVMSIKHDVSSNTKTKKIGSKEYEISNISWVLSVNAHDPLTDEIIDSVVQKDALAEMGDESRAQERMVTKVLETQVPTVSSWVYKLIFSSSGY